jgi:hypothetical protein
MPMIYGQWDPPTEMQTAYGIIMVLNGKELRQADLLNHVVFGAQGKLISGWGVLMHPIGIMMVYPGQSFANTKLKGMTMLLHREWMELLRMKFMQ